jgi:hypothetical protein
MAYIFSIPRHFQSEALQSSSHHHSLPFINTASTTLKILMAKVITHFLIWMETSLLWPVHLSSFMAVLWFHTPRTLPFLYVLRILHALGCCRTRTCCSFWNAFPPMPPQLTSTYPLFSAHNLIPQGKKHPDYSHSRVPVISSHAFLSFTFVILPSFG